MEEQLERDIAIYTAYLERALRYLKLVGIVPKDRDIENADPDLHGIFVPLRVTTTYRDSPAEVTDNDDITAAFSKPTQKGQQSSDDSIVDLLKLLSSKTDSPRLVLLGGPGSGKSTAVRHLAWSHAAAHRGISSGTLLLARKGISSRVLIPLRIELRRLVEENRSYTSYDFLAYTKEMLKREAVEIDSRMFEQLLAEKTLLVLFDGLDEVATLADRRVLVNEIETFVQRYPGNCVLVTSRPVGYDLSPLSPRLFVHEQIQEFDNKQIRQFLERWYTHVLHLSPIPHNDQQELEALVRTLQENPRLHKLAENPLLLAVITALHRYERLPDRRVLVYDRCAELLLETWAKLRGTDKRWHDMRMSKEDQYACVARLGFILHQRSQRQGETESTTDTASDVSASFMLHEIEQFIQQQRLVIDTLEQKSEADLLLALMQEEVGLMVERGTGSGGESLYGFVHRTFQEYFAATYIYNQYLQEEDPSIVSRFLVEHLHDPHWREVILLLLGKLRRRPVTAQLRRILQGTLKSRRSHYTDLVRQDLFFVCGCLSEEIAVESDLVEMVLADLSELLKHSPFSSQRKEALEVFTRLIRTRQYTNPARRTLVELIAQQSISGVETKILAAQMLYRDSDAQPEARQLAANVLCDTIEQFALPARETAEILGELCTSKTAISAEVQQRSADLLLSFVLQPDTHIQWSLWGFLGHQIDEISERIQLIVQLMQHPKIAFNPTLIAYIVHELVGYAGEMSGHLSAHPPAQAAINNAIQLGMHKLLGLIQQHNFSSFEEMLSVAQVLRNNPQKSQEHQLALQLVWRLAKWPNLSIEQILQVAQFFYESSYYYNQKNKAVNSKEYRQAASMLWQLLQRPDPSLEETLQIAEAIYKYNMLHSSKDEHTFAILWQLILHPDLSDRQLERIFNLLYGGVYWSWDRNAEKSRKVTLALLNLMEQPNCPPQKVAQIGRIMSDYVDNESSFLLKKAQQPGIQFEERLWIIAAFSLHGSPNLASRQQAISMLIDLTQEENLSTEEVLQTTLLFYESASYIDSPFHQKAVQMLWNIAKMPGLAVEKIIQIAEALLRLEDQQTVQILSHLLQYPNLTFKQTVRAARDILYGEAEIRDRLEEEEYSQLDMQFLWRLVQERKFTDQQRAQIAAIPLTLEKTTYRERAYAVDMVLALLKGEDSKILFQNSWVSILPSVKARVSDIPSIVMLAKQESLPVGVRDEMYQLLQRKVPEFDKISLSEEFNEI
jgi:NACHT domain